MSVIYMQVVRRSHQTCWTCSHLDYARIDIYSLSNRDSNICSRHWPNTGSYHLHRSSQYCNLHPWVRLCVNALSSIAAVGAHVWLFLRAKQCAHALASIVGLVSGPARALAEFVTFGLSIIKPTDRPAGLRTSRGRKAANQLPAKTASSHKNTHTHSHHKCHIQCSLMPALAHARN